MIKNGVIQPGVTPSVVSGRPSDLIKSGEAVCRDEEPEPQPEEELKGRIPLEEEHD